MRPSLDSTYLTAEEVCTRLKISRHTLADIVRRGSLPVVKISRRKMFYREADFQRLLTPASM